METILIVEDDVDIRETVSEVLREEGFLVLEAADSREAYSALLSGLHQVRLILLDLMTPVMSGWELLEALKGDPGLSSIPVVVTTASLAVPTGLPILKKPYSIEDVIGLAERHGARRRYPRSQPYRSVAPA